MAHEFRAVPSRATDLENDPDVMVHQQLARLLFLMRRVNQPHSSVLEFGCGAGFNCAYLRASGISGRICGFDLSEAAVDLARQRYRGLDFRVADACDPILDLGLESWDFVVSFEVLEHVAAMPIFVRNIRRHLKPSGTAFISTPNRLVFSLGHEPSPVNREHLKELVLDEFVEMLSPHFASIEIFGQRFRTEELLQGWKADVREKIEQLEQGTRWIRPRSRVDRLRKLAIVNSLYQIGPIRRAWKLLRWDLLGRYENYRLVKKRPYSFKDFDFVADDLSNAVWFCAIARP